MECACTPAGCQEKGYMKFSHIEWQWGRHALWNFWILAQKHEDTSKERVWSCTTICLGQRKELHSAHGHLLISNELPENLQGTCKVSANSHNETVSFHQLYLHRDIKFNWKPTEHKNTKLTKNGLIPHCCSPLWTTAQLWFWPGENYPRRVERTRLKGWRNTNHAIGFHFKASWRWWENI